VSDKLYEAVFGDAEPSATESIENINVQTVTDRVTAFAMENPELGRVWLFEVLSSQRPANDRFWHQYQSNFEQFAQSEFAQPGIDTEMMSVLSLVGSFLWPAWIRAHTRTAKERQELAERFSRELLRLSLHGTMRPEKYPELSARLTKSNRRTPRTRD
jgi:hypothetical protein